MPSISDLNNAPTVISSVGVCPLTKGGAVSELVTCTAAGTDYAATGTIPTGTRYVEIGCDSSCVVAIGEATSTTLGRFAPSGGAVFPVLAAAAGQHIDVQSATAGAIVRIAYLAA